jgi:hypothetical protein
VTMTISEASQTPRRCSGERPYEDSWGEIG